MTSKKPNSKSKKTVATKAGKQKTDQIGHQSQVDDRVSIYVRISREAKDILESAAKPPITMAKVIEELLANYERQDLETKEKILSGQNVNPLKEFGEVLELINWAQHAFENKRYIWAAKLYKRIANSSNASSGLKNICNYRLGICWIRLSYEVRQEALSESNDYESFDLALEALNKAINYTKKVKENLGSNRTTSKLIINYNLACCYSLRAQYQVEAKLDPKSKLVGRLYNAGQDNKAVEEVWTTIGEIWRENYKEGNVDSDAKKAFDELQEIFSIPSHRKVIEGEAQKVNSGLPSERIWLVTSALTDEDLIFLRLDRQKWQPEFKKLSDLALQDNKSNVDTVRDLLNEP